MDRATGWKKIAQNSICVWVAVVMFFVHGHWQNYLYYSVLCLMLVVYSQLLFSRFYGFTCTGVFLGKRHFHSAHFLFSFPSWFSYFPFLCHSKAVFCTIIGRLVKKGNCALAVCVVRWWLTIFLVYWLNDNFIVHFWKIAFGLKIST